MQARDFILTQFDDDRASFLQQVFAAGRMGKKWLTLDMLTIEQQLQEPKARIIKALDYLAEKNWIELSVVNLRQGYKNNRIITTAEQLSRLCDYLNQLFVERERRDIQRIHSLLDYANNPGCLSQQLLQYFGESTSTPCGICNHCRQAISARISVAEQKPITLEQRQLIAALKLEAHKGLMQPRQLARFLCGLPSPAISRSALKNHPAFGALAEWSFPLILAAVE